MGNKDGEYKYLCEDMKRTNWKKLYEAEKLRADTAQADEKAAREMADALVRSDLVMNITDKVELTDEIMRNVRSLFIAGGEVTFNAKKTVNLLDVRLFKGSWNLGSSTLNLGGWDPYLKEHAKNLELCKKIAEYEERLKQLGKKVKI